MVEWKKLGEVLAVHTGKQLNRSGLSEVGAYPVINGGRTPSGYTDNYNENKNSITISQGGESAGFINWIDTAFWAGAHCYVVENTTNQNLRFLFHLLKNNEYGIMESKQGAGIPGLNRKNLYSILIPIPSLEEQKRIVGILDTFTDSIENLKQQIAQRRKQYEFYRNQLLDNVSITEKIGKLTKVFSCPRVYKDQWKDSGIPFWRSSDVMSYHNRVKNPRGEVYISQSLFEELLQKSEKIEKGDILVTGGGSIGIPYLKKDNNPLFVKDADLICIKKCEGIIPSFLYHFFFSTSFRLYLKKITHDATIAHYTISQILETPIPLPPLSEQSRIVSILDTFEASISNLEAQLEQRQKQYEYYRNQLLTFEGG